jgi:molecular chaperone DnaK (HSP70)
MGATATKVAAVRFAPVVEKSGDKNDTFGAMTVLSTAVDTSLGGALFSSALVDALTARAAQDPRGNARAMAKLRKEADRTKNVLSANTETVSIVAIPVCFN